MILAALETVHEEMHRVAQLRDRVKLQACIGAPAGHGTTNHQPSKQPLRAVRGGASDRAL